MNLSGEKLERKHVYEYPSKWEDLKRHLKKKRKTISAWFRKNREKELRKAR